MDHIVHHISCDTLRQPHDWREEYYGWRCIKCKQLVPFSCEPWAPIDDDASGEDDWRPRDCLAIDDDPGM